MRRSRQGLGLLQQARQKLDDNAAPESAHAISAFLHSVAHAKLGDRASARSELRNAERKISSGGALRWPWIFPLEAPRAAAFQVSILARLGDHPAAAAALDSVPAGQIAPWRRAEAQTDHAWALARAKRIDEATELTGQTLRIARRYGLDRIVRRIRTLNAQLPHSAQIAVDKD